MKILKILSSAIFCAAGLAALGAKANAAIIPVADPNFNQFPVGQTANSYENLKFCGVTAPGCQFADKPVVGWTASGTFAKGIVSGQYQIGDLPNFRFNEDPPFTGPITPPPPPPTVERAQNASISQIVGPTAVAGVTYTLDVDLGFAKDAEDKALVSIVIGKDSSALAIPLGSDTLTAPAIDAKMQETGNFYDFETSYTATAADAGDPIEILLSSLNSGQGFSYFADVRLTDSLAAVDPVATPEPATWAMMLIGFGGMAGVAAVRRSSQRRSAVGQLA
jgi:hypothetical protein